MGVDCIIADDYLCINCGLLKSAACGVAKLVLKVKFGVKRSKNRAVYYAERFTALLRADNNTNNVDRYNTFAINCSSLPPTWSSPSIRLTALQLRSHIWQSATLYGNFTDVEIHFIRDLLLLLL